MIFAEPASFRWAIRKTPARRDGTANNQFGVCARGTAPSFYLVEPTDGALAYTIPQGPLRLLRRERLRCLRDPRPRLRPRPGRLTNALRGQARTRRYPMTRAPVPGSSTDHPNGLDPTRKSTVDIRRVCCRATRLAQTPGFGTAIGWRIPGSRHRDAPVWL
ncbi:hypothetical protein Aglo03_03670 [Actinokineospora globicatena]|uniref:Uncharacterized protein n=1 Tax=Actinokineospora globicatena TaxID=103729 RepID=A0A9W6QEP4_9PSEU|nr:hypothetical protein Aglo03_03670 [Actinokineospora globicatena]